MPPLPPAIVVSVHHLLLLLLLLVFSITAMALDDNIQQPKFREAPQFYNSHGCPPPLLPSSTDCPSSALVHVAMTLDVAYLRGSIAAIHSVLKHTSCPQSIRFHLVASTSIDRLSSTIASSFPSLSFKVYPFDGAPLAGLISASVREALDRPLNYARSYLADILPSCVGRVVYLDSDLVVVDDIQSLATTSLGGGEVLAAPEHCKANFTAYFTRAFWGNAALSGAFAGRRACYFNTGVMVMDLGRWRAGGHTWRIEDWMRLQRRMRIYELGSLPPFLLEFAGRIAAVDDRWNQHGLGGDNYRGRCRDLHPGPVSLLHWSGKGKPWARIDAGRPCPLDALWAPYDLLLRAHPIGES